MKIQITGLLNEQVEAMIDLVINVFLSIKPVLLHACRKVYPSNNSLICDIIVRDYCY